MTFRSLLGLIALVSLSGSSALAQTQLQWNINRSIITSSPVCVSEAGLCKSQIFTLNWGTGLAQLTIDSGNSNAAWPAPFVGNKDGYRFTLGGFPLSAEFGGGALPIGAALVGGVDIPAGAGIGAASFGTAGYARTFSDTNGGVGVYGDGRIATSGSGSAWGMNCNVSNSLSGASAGQGRNNAGIYCLEGDTTLVSVAGVANPNFFAYGTDLIGGVIGFTSGMVTNHGHFFDAVRIAALIGDGVVPDLPWPNGVFTEDNGAVIGVSLGTEGAGTNVGSQALELRNRNNLGVDGSGFVFSDPTGNLHLSPVPGTFVLLDDGSGNTVLGARAGVILFNVAPTFATETGYVQAHAGSVSTAAATIPLSDLASQATNTIDGNATAGSAAPAALPIGSCDTATKALQWTTNTGFACNSSINAATLGGATFAAPGAIGSGTPGTGAFTTLSATGQFTSTLAPGTAPLVIASTTLVPNLYVARAALADSTTTNANQTGDVTSVGNVTSYNNVVSGAKGGTGVTNTGKTITIGANITTTGAGAPTLAFPASPFTYTYPGASQTLASLAGTEAFTNKDLTGAGNTFPTLNQNTTGSAAKWTTARNLAGNSVDGSANVAYANKFIVQGTTDPGLSGAQFLGALGTCILKNTTTTGVLSCTTAGTDYLTSVGLSFTGGLISVGSSPLTINGTIALTVAGTSGGIPYFASTSTWASSALLASNAIMLGGGAGNPPTTTTTGTGTVAALGVNVGTAGAFVVNGGALGTPSSGTGTNLTGIPTTGLSGTLQAAQEPAHTGDVTNSAGSLALTIAANVVTNAKAAQMAANTFKGNNTGGTANASDLTVTQAQVILSPAGAPFTPTLSCAVGTLTTASATGSTLTKGQWVDFSALITITTAGSCTYLQFTLPDGTALAANVFPASETNAGGFYQARVSAGASSNIISSPSNIGTVNNGEIYRVTARYQKS